MPSCAQGGQSCLLPHTQGSPPLALCSLAGRRGGELAQFTAIKKLV